MIDLKGMISIQLLKKEAFCGSDEKMRYRLYKEETGGEAKLAAYGLRRTVGRQLLQKKKQYNTLNLRQMEFGRQ